jgi:hypothetical protein
MSSFFPEVWQDLHEVSLDNEYNPNVISLDSMVKDAAMRGRKDELYDVLMLLKQIKSPTKQIQGIITTLMSRWDEYGEQTS